ncbi:MAG TPA: LON peptidase substrate-binding domain-containing protein [Xanthobacteraceae bacterium]|nr:LON peptidase substrate-binding domain-containing protein [Xanthobacteraceae bacterium]
MTVSAHYRAPEDLPDTIPVFPLAGALLLPRAQLPLNIFEPRYLAMTDDAMKGARVIGMVQPDESKSGSAAAPALFSVGGAGKITQFAETGDGRYVITLTGIARFRIKQELPATTLYRQCRVDFAPFRSDLTPRLGEEHVDRETLLKTLADYLRANKLEADWKDINEAPTEALVNGLSMMSPYGVREKQALLEAPDLKARADVLVAITEMALAKDGDNDLPMQ